MTISAAPSPQLSHVPSEGERGAHPSATGRVAGSPNAGALSGNPADDLCHDCGAYVGAVEASTVWPDPKQPRRVLAFRSRDGFVRCEECYCTNSRTQVMKALGRWLRPVNVCVAYVCWMIIQAFAMGGAR